MTIAIESIAYGWCAKFKDCEGCPLVKSEGACIGTLSMMNDHDYIQLISYLNSRMESLALESNEEASE